MFKQLAFDVVIVKNFWNVSTSYNFVSCGLYADEDSRAGTACSGCFCDSGLCDIFTVERMFWIQRSSGCWNLLLPLETIDNKIIRSEVAEECNKSFTWFILLQVLIKSINCVKIKSCNFFCIFNFCQLMSMSRF